MRRRSSSGLRKKLLESRARKMKKEGELLREYAGRISSRHLRSAVVLFGSRARGDYLPYSDYDVAVILEDVGDKLAAIEEFRRLKPRGLPLDLLVIRVDELSDPLVSKMLEGCIVLYDGLGIASSLKSSLRYGGRL